MEVIVILRAIPNGRDCLPLLSALFQGFTVLSIDTSATVVSVTVEAQDQVGLCPGCGYESRSVHSSYVRRLRDLPILGRPVVVLAKVRRFRCQNSGCSRKTFAEPLGNLALAHAQRTKRLTAQLLSLILTTSSRSATRLAHQMGIQTSPRTLLRTVDRSVRSATAPRALGIDDFALRRGRTYGTVFCDLESGRPVDIILGRSTEAVSNWLKERPGVEIIARDRATAYAEAARQGAPAAIQVADRFHLVRNVSDALREVVDGRSWSLPEMPGQGSHPADPQPAPLSRPRTKAESARQAAAERLRRRHEEACRRYANGESIRAISKAMGLDRKTVTKYVKSPDPPRRAARRQPARKIDPHVPYLKERWLSGCHNVRKLYEEIRDRGYSGSYSNLRHALVSWRTAKGPGAGAGPGSSRPSLVWRDVRWALLCPPEHQTEVQRQMVEQILALHPDLALAHSLLQRFRQMLREHQVGELNRWLDDAMASGLPPFKRLARTLTADKAAVLAAIELPWSTGPVEGIITRIKFMKRLGYGRASLPLLRARVIGSLGV